MKLSQEALTTISTGVVDLNTFTITAGQLDRKLYLEVNEALENIGGEWNRKLKAHIFDADPTGKIEDLLLTGETINEKQLYQFFETPRDVAERVVELADTQKGMTLLEPEAGRGALLDAVPDVGARHVTAVELDPKHISILQQKGYYTVHQDFMTYPLPSTDIPAWDRIIMNPPFTRQQDIDHVLHAFDLLSPGGRLVAIMSPGFTFRQNKKSVEFRELVELCGSYEPLPDDSFKDSGTGVNTVIVILDK